MVVALFLFLYLGYYFVPSYYCSEGLDDNRTVQAINIQQRNTINRSCEMEKQAVGGWWLVMGRRSGGGGGGRSGLAPPLCTSLSLSFFCSFFFFFLLFFLSGDHCFPRRASHSLLLPRFQKRPKLSYVIDCMYVCMYRTYDGYSSVAVALLSVTGSLERPFWKICMVSDRRQVLGRFASE